MMERQEPVRVLFLCTRNSARSQIAEALLVHEGGARFEVASAGAEPGMSVDPMTFEVLDELGIDWRAHRPKGFDVVQDTEWDLVVTVCNRAREACPVLPGSPMFAHWSLEDPEDQLGSVAQRRAYFHRIVALVHDCIQDFVTLGVGEWTEQRLAACFRPSLGTDPRDGRRAGVR